MDNFMRRQWKSKILMFRLSLSCCLWKMQSHKFIYNTYNAYYYNKMQTTGTMGTCNYILMSHNTQFFNHEIA